jgi:hypothetical protein
MRSPEYNRFWMVLAIDAIAIGWFLVRLSSLFY